SWSDSIFSYRLWQCRADIILGVATRETPSWIDLMHSSPARRLRSHNNLWQGANRVPSLAEIADVLNYRERNREKVSIVEKFWNTPVAYENSISPHNGRPHGVPVPTAPSWRDARSGRRWRSRPASSGTALRRARAWGRASSRRRSSSSARPP